MEHQTKNTNTPIAENFEFFVNITRLTLERYPKKFHSWTAEMQEYLEHVKSWVEHYFFMVKYDKDFELPLGETAVSYCQKQFEDFYGLHIYMAWGAWSEGYFDNFSRRSREHVEYVQKMKKDLEFPELPF